MINESMIEKRNTIASKPKTIIANRIASIIILTGRTKVIANWKIVLFRLSQEIVES